MKSYTLQFLKYMFNWSTKSQLLHIISGTSPTIKACIILLEGVILQRVNISMFLQSFTKYLWQTLVFMLDSALRGKFNIYFSGDFCWYWQNFDVERRNRIGNNYIWSFEVSVIFLNFLRSYVFRLTRDATGI